MVNTTLPGANRNCRGRPGRHNDPVPPAFTLKNFFDSRNTILITRKTGGIGDILVHRMLFEDFKLLNPEIRVAFACPARYHQAILGHPHVDEVLDSDGLDESRFLARYDTTVICGHTEMIHAPQSYKNRSDIWAEWIGIDLTRHDMHLSVADDERAEVASRIEAVRDRPGPTVAVCPVSAITSKNLQGEQLTGLVRGLKDLGCFPYGIHSAAIPEFDAPVLAGTGIRNFLALVEAADYVIAVDSAAFHARGGFGKPMVGVFSWADGRVYGQHYKNWDLVQRHRADGDWDCGPCYNWGSCPKVPARENMRKPCITEITAEEILAKFKSIASR